MKVTLNITSDNNANKVKYDPEALEKAFKEWIDSPFPCFLTSGVQDLGINMKEVIGVCNSVVKDGDRFIADIRIVRSPEFYESLINTHRVKISGYGTFNDENIVNDLKLNYVYLSDEPK